MDPIPADQPVGDAFDPTAPLGGPPDPWTATDRPSLRAGPPFHMTDMIAAEPALARRLLGRLGTDPAATAFAIAVHETAAAGLPIVTTGCGTSEHGALGAADLLRDALRNTGSPTPGSVTAAQAFELALDPPATGLVIGISHEGGTRATNQALEAARSAGARTALITVTHGSPGASLAEPGLVVETGELDRSWCHTVGYLSPLLAAFAVGERLAGRPLDGAAIDGVAGAVAAGNRDVAVIEDLAEALADRSRLIVVASGFDRTAGRELVLKVEEGSWLPSAYRDLETILHGHWPGTDASTGMVLVLTDRSARPARVARAGDVLRAAREIGIRSGAILATGVAADLDPGLTPAGRVVVPEAPSLPAPGAALFATATALQLLTERLARTRGTNPDPIRRDDPIYVAAGAAAEG